MMSAIQTIITQLKAGTLASGKLLASALSGIVPTANLGSGSATSATFLRGDQTWATAGGTTISTTVAGLGAATDGKIGRLRLGSSPYQFIGLVYDATYGKWVSEADAVWSAEWNIGGSNSGIQAQVKGDGTGSVDFISCLVRYREAQVAGLHLQARFIGSVHYAAAGDGSFGYVTYTGNTGAGTLGLSHRPTNAITLTNNSDTLVDLGWLDLTTDSFGPTAYDMVGAGLYINPNGATTSLVGGTLYFRWTG